MEHVAIDLGGRESQICVRAADGRIVQETRVRTRELSHYLKTRPPSRVIVETCAESFAVADAARAFGHEVRVVPATLVPALGVGSRKTKNDRRDCQLLSEASCRIDLPSVHVPSQVGRARKTMLSMHESLVSSRTMMVNAVRGWMRTQMLAVGTGAVETFPARVRAALVGEVPPPHIERVLKTIEELTKQVRDAERELERTAKSDAICRRLMSVPGVGPMTALGFASSVDQIERFADAHKVESYLGLVPGERSSSEHQQRLSITKAGSTRTRWLLVQAAWCARRHAATHPMVKWSLEVEKRRGKRMAIVALARKLAGILYALWRDGTVYDSKAGARPSPVA